MLGLYEVLVVIKKCTRILEFFSDVLSVLQKINQKIILMMESVIQWVTRLLQKLISTTWNVGSC